MSWKKALAAGAVALGLLGSACGGDDGGTANGGGNGNGDGDDGGTAVSMRDFSFNPASVTVSSGDTISLTNEGEASHTFTIEEGAIDEELEPGASADVTIDLEAGDYEFICEFHPQMTGTLTVS
jgi:plastocyanin